MTYPENKGTFFSLRTTQGNPEDPKHTSAVPGINSYGRLPGNNEEAAPELLLLMLGVVSLVR